MCRSGDRFDSAPQLQVHARGLTRQRLIFFEGVGAGLVDRGRVAPGAGVGVFTSLPDAMGPLTPQVGLLLPAGADVLPISWDKLH
jgi:hypothetical protein